MENLSPISLNINFDSLGEAFGYPPGFRDPSFFEVFDRIAELVAQYGARLTLFVIGRDLRNPEIAARVREWAEAGHEIGNHSWSHHMDLGALSQNQVDQEIERAHEVITNAIGQEPRGFIAPAWNTSRKVAKCLVRLGYKYDTSLFPSIFLYPVMARIAINHINNKERIWRSINRRDWMFPVLRPIKPYYADIYYRPAEPGPGTFLVLPLPTLGRHRLPYWHTLGFLLGWDRACEITEEMLRRHDAFYYLMHPADFADLSDLDSEYQHSLERLEIPKEVKFARFSEILDIMKSSGRPFATMDEMADCIAIKLNG